MRIKSDPQEPLDLSPSTLRVTQAYYQKYGAIDQILKQAPGILDAFHKDIVKTGRDLLRRRRSQFTSVQLLRAILVMVIEQLSFRAAVVRIDDSVFLRRFIGVPFGPVMDFTTLSKAYKAIRPATWKRINELLSRYAVDQKQIRGEALRVDTTAYETNIHYPTDSSLLWDGYRVLGRLLGRIRDYAPELVGERRLQVRKVKRLTQLIARRAQHKAQRREKLRKPYKALLASVSGILEWSEEVHRTCHEAMGGGRYDLDTVRVLESLLDDLGHYTGLTARVMDQARRRVLLGEDVPSDEKVLSIFEPHTEILVRGKAGKAVEFGHMVLLHQVENKFISDYEVFKKRPSDESLVDAILARHEKQFGSLPEAFTADKGFYENMQKIGELEQKITHVSIAKKGSRTAAEIDREHDPVFRSWQRFRAGIEGTISYLKRCLKLGRCLYRSFKTYCSSVGCHIFVHNLLVLARL